MSSENTTVEKDEGDENESSKLDWMLDIVDVLFELW